MSRVSELQLAIERENIAKLELASATAMKELAIRRLQMEGWVKIRVSHTQIWVSQELLRETSHIQSKSCEFWKCLRDKEFGVDYFIED